MCWWHSEGPVDLQPSESSVLGLVELQTGADTAAVILARPLTATGRGGCGAATNASLPSQWLQVSAGDKTGVNKQPVCVGGAWRQSESLGQSLVARGTPGIVCGSWARSRGWPHALWVPGLKEVKPSRLCWMWENSPFFNLETIKLILYWSGWCCIMLVRNLNTWGVCLPTGVG